VIAVGFLILAFSDSRTAMVIGITNNGQGKPQKSSSRSRLQLAPEAAFRVETERKEDP
jgi:hypothetical protein